MVCQFVVNKHLIVFLTVTNGIYLDAQKSGTEYYWSTGAKAYFTTADVTNAGMGNCVYISKLTNDLQGTDCSNTYNVVCQSSKFCFSFKNVDI